MIPAVQNNSLNNSTYHSLEPNYKLFKRPYSGVSSSCRPTFIYKSDLFLKMLMKKNQKWPQCLSKLRLFLFNSLRLFDTLEYFRVPNRQLVLNKRNWGLILKV